MPAAELAEVAAGIFGRERVSETASIADAIDQAAGMAEAGGVLRGGDRLAAACWSRARWSRSARRGRDRCARGGSTPDAATAVCVDPAARGDRLRAEHTRADLGAGGQHRHGAVDRPRAHPGLPAGRRALGFPWGYWLGWAIQVAAIARRLRRRRRCSSSARSSWRCGPPPGSSGARSRSSAHGGRRRGSTRGLPSPTAPRLRTDRARCGRA